MSGAAVSSGCIVGRNGVRLWGLEGAERIARQLRSVGVSTLLGGDDAAPEGSVVLLRADYLFEDRTIADLVQRPGIVVTTSGDRGAAASVAAHVAGRDLAVARAVLEGTTPPDAIPGAVTRTPESLSTSFLRKLHKSVPPVVLPVRADRARALERHLFDGSYKGVTDLVTKWVWPRPARAVVGVCTRYGISPNAVTSMSLVLVLLVTLLFAQGRFGIGLVLAWIMTFLDTVDGKLARVTVTSTRVGHFFDHSIDTIHPPIWYFAWAWGVTGGPPGIWAMAPLLTAILVFYVAGRLIETGFKQFVAGFPLFSWRPFDSYFRLIMARRNPNLLLLCTSYLLGVPRVGLSAVAVWTVASTLILAVRFLQAVYFRSQHGAPRPWLEELGGESASVAAWARPFVADLAAVRHLVQ